MTDKFDDKTVTQLKHAINTAFLLGMESLIIDSTSTRAKSDETQLFMLSKTVTSDSTEFDSIGIGRVSVLRARMQLLGDDFTIIPEYKTKDNGDSILFKLKLKKGKTAIDFKCTDPAKLSIQKNFNDEMCFAFELSEETIRLLNRIPAAMNTNNVSFSCSDEKTVEIKICDDQADSFNHLVSESVELLAPQLKTKFSSAIKLKTLFPLLKEERGNVVKLNVSKRGIFNLKVNGLDCYIFPEV